MTEIQNKIDRKIKFVKDGKLRAKLGYIFLAIIGRKYEPIIETVILNGFSMAISMTSYKDSKYNCREFFEPLLIDTFEPTAKEYHLSKFDAI